MVGCKKRNFLSSQIKCHNAPIVNASLGMLDTPHSRQFGEHGTISVSERYPSLTAHQHQKGHTVPKQV